MLPMVNCGIGFKGTVLNKIYIYTEIEQHAHILFVCNNEATKNKVFPVSVSMFNVFAFFSQLHDMYDLDFTQCFQLHLQPMIIICDCYSVTDTYLMSTFE